MIVKILCTLVSLLLWKPSLAFHNSFKRMPSRYLSGGVTAMSSSKSTEHAKFIETFAKKEAPRRIESLCEILELAGERLISPNDRKGLNPFLIPISQNQTDGTKLCYIRWPTQKEDMELQLVRTTDTGNVWILSIHYEFNIF